MLRIFIGYDSNEVVAYHVCAHSIIKRASGPVSITPIKLSHVPEFHRDKKEGSTEFSFSRFLTPYLSGYSGQSIFMDCDMLVLTDIYEILKEVRLDSDVSVVKHDYTPKHDIKFLGNKQAAYPRKNWSSVMVFNNYTAPCKKLLPQYVSEKSGAHLHQFEWCKDERIGELSAEWNHLVGEYDYNPNAKIAHFTLGTPCFRDYQKQEYAETWFNEYEDMISHAN